MPVSRLIQAHFRQLVNLEGAAFVALRRVYEQFVAEATAEAAWDSPDGESWSEQHRSAILAQVETALEVMATSTVETLAEQFLQAANTGAGQTLAEVRDLEARFGSAEFLARIDLMPPVIPAEAVAHIAQPGNLALANFRDATAQRVSDALAQSVLQGEGISEARRRLAAEMTAHNWELERIARTEINNAMNFGHEATINRVAADMPEMQLQKRWSSHFDARTSDVCRSLGADGGQVRDIGQDFETSADGGWRGAYPPAHPNCRSRVLPYSARWATRATEAGKALACRAPCLHTFALFKGPSAPSSGAKARDMTKPNHETKSFTMEFKALDEAGTFSGYASVFGNVDQGGDIVHPGAFKRTLNAYRQSKKRIPLLYGHETGLREVVGYIDPADIVEDGKGLRLTKGVLMIDDLEAARAAYALMKNGVLTDMSFGYDAIKRDWTGTTRNLREVKLYEVSLVLWPMNEESNVTDVKGAPVASKAADFATILRREVVEADLYEKRWKMNSALAEAMHGAMCDAEMSEADAINLIDDSLSQYHVEMMAWARAAIASGIYTEAKGEGPDEIKVGRRFSAATVAHINGAITGAENFVAELKALLADPAAKDSEEGKGAPPAPADSEAKGHQDPAETPAADPEDHSARFLAEVMAWPLTA